MRYFDCTKFDYKKFGKEASKELIERDKQAYKHSLLSWIETEIDSIVERKWDIDNIGIVEETGDFIKLIKESELSYSLGAYYSVISLIGVASEDLCKYFANLKNHNDLLNNTQFNRINELKNRGVINQDISDEFHFIRKIRNDCLHFDTDFKSKNRGEIKNDALLCVNKLKSIYKKLFSSLNSDEYERGELISKVTEDYAKQKAYDTSFGDTLNEEEFAMKLRYFVAEELELDLAIAKSGERIVKNCIFRVDEIDLTKVSGFKKTKKITTTY